MAAIASGSASSVPLHFAEVGKHAGVTPLPSLSGTAAFELRNTEESVRFEGEVSALNLRNARLGAWFVMLLVPFCGVLDWLAYPERFWDFLLLRIACSVLCVPLLLALNRPMAARFHRLYPILLPVLPALAICFMIYLTGDGSSGYYAGLCLCLVGTSFVFHWTFREIGITVGLVMAFYLAATIPNLHFSGDLRSIGVFINNTVFMLLMCVVLYFGSRQHHAIRLREFVNRCQVEAQREELRHRNEELTATLKRLRETEAQLAQSEKLASIGRLSAGIVHEINNPLNFVKSAIFVLKKKTNVMTDNSNALQEILTDISEGVDRVANIVSDLRTFAHPEARSACPISLHHATGKALRLMAKHVNDRGARLTCDISPEVFALADENHLIQILLNLVQNSLDALADHPSPQVTISAVETAEVVMLSVRDNGSGIPEEHLQRIFDPFFTTKGVGQGMGLGLSLCYRMMQQMGGSIEASSQPGEFTVFTLRLPSLLSDA